MKTSEFDYTLPEDLIAQHPPEKRGESRLLVFNRKNGDLLHLRFSEIASFFNSNDLFVFNDTKVIPARLLGRKKSGGAAEILLVREEGKDIWEAMVKASGRIVSGLCFDFERGLSAEILEKRGDFFLIKLSHPVDAWNEVEMQGKMPLPPYIKREAESQDTYRYQTIFAASPGAVAAPTAALHFTEEMLSDFEARGIGRACVTLHVGPGTFRPVKVENISEHEMHREWFSVDEKTAEKINTASRKGGRIVAVGTTVVRTLESAFSQGNALPKTGFTDIFICPGHRFGKVDCLVTNFHLPRSTLFMLVSAFVGTERLKEIYAEAVRERYRFFSYGDAMLIL